jgi:hypothetical protein
MTENFDKQHGEATANRNEEPISRQQSRDDNKANEIITSASSPQVRQI